MRQEDLAQRIAHDFAKHLTPQARQMPMFTTEDYVHISDALAWRGDVFVDDGYVFGAHILVTHRKTMQEARNANMESLFIYREPGRPNIHGEWLTEEYTTLWLGNEVQFFRGSADWYRHARMSFMDWYTGMGMRKRDEDRWEQERRRREGMAQTERQFLNAWRTAKPIRPPKKIDPKKKIPGI
jgi:hypothetical protein